ncbi:uncharacterized protein LOC135848618 [Planococcus citri]|uniref:uncharacterized protein LOC135848618 n=1 Tax=Planococcus citri TaxID=170843 RepID=UPI0031F983A8
MNTKVSLIIVVGVLAHTLLWTPCNSFPLWSWFDSSEKTSSEAEAETGTTTTTVNESQIKTKSETPPPVAATPTPVQQDVSSLSAVVSDTSKDTSASGQKTSSGERFDVRPFVQNAGIARAPLGFLAGLAKIGADGLKSVVQTGTDLGSTSMDQVSMLQDRVIDSTQNAITRGTQKSLDNIVPMMSRLDTYRRSFSGGTKANADKAHSITITTSSDAPINSMYSFAKDFMPAGASGSSALPPITSIDFSKFLR